MGNLKLPAEELAEDNSVSASQNPYGYGTTMYLRDEQIAAAGGTACKVGQRVKITGWANVTSTSLREEVDPDGTKEMCQSLELQVTDMDLGTATDPAEAAKTMYPGMS